MTVSSATLQALVTAALMGKTAAGARVFTPRTWSTASEDMPLLLVQAPKETKTSLGRSGAPQFTCVTTIRVIGRVYVLAEAGDAGAAAALAAAGDLQRQIEVAVINDFALHREVQNFAGVEVVTGVSKDAEQVFGETILDFALEFYQGPEDFAPIDGDPILELAIYADLLNVFSPTGVFDETPFAADATPPPRTSGPDGRLEGVALIILPEE